MRVNVDNDHHHKEEYVEAEEVVGPLVDLLVIVFQADVDVVEHEEDEQEELHVQHKIKLQDAFAQRKVLVDV